MMPTGSYIGLVQNSCADNVRFLKYTSNCSFTNKCVRGDPKGFFLLLDSFFQEFLGILTQYSFFFVAYRSVITQRHALRLFYLFFLFASVLPCGRPPKFRGGQACSSAPSVPINDETSLPASERISWTGAVSSPGLCAVSSIGLGAMSSVLVSSNNYFPFHFTCFRKASMSTSRPISAKPDTVVW